MTGKTNLSLSATFRGNHYRAPDMRTQDSGRDALSSRIFIEDTEMCFLQSFLIRPLDKRKIHPLSQAFSADTFTAVRVMVVRPAASGDLT